MSGKATVNVDDGAEDIRWIRDLGGEQFPAASYTLLPNLKKRVLRVYFFPSARDRDFVACFLHSSAQMCLCQTPGRRRPLITGRFVNTAVRGPTLDGISIRAAVVCFPLLLCTGWR